jgi:hypothetical protein
MREPVTVIEIPPFQPFETVPFPDSEERIALHPERGPVPSLETVLKDLHESEINAGLQTFHPDGLRIWIGDQLNGLTASAHMARGDRGWLVDGTIARWLHEKAVALYPDSDYARRSSPQATPS